MKTEFDLEAIGQAGRNKGERDWKKCKSSDKAFAVAIAWKIMNIDEQISSFWGHRLIHLTSLTSAANEDIMLFKQSLIINLAAQYLVIRANCALAEISDAYTDLANQKAIRYLPNPQFPDCVVDDIKNTSLDFKRAGDTCGNIYTEVVNFYSKIFYGFWSAQFDDLFDKRYPQDEEHAKIKGKIESMFKDSAVITWQDFTPS
jgi:hypothetical protein